MKTVYSLFYEKNFVDTYKNLSKAYEAVAEMIKEYEDEDYLEITFIEELGYKTIEDGLNAVRTAGKHLEKFDYYIRERDVK